MIYKPSQRRGSRPTISSTTSKRTQGFKPQGKSHSTRQHTAPKRARDCPHLQAPTHPSARQGTSQAPTSAPSELLHAVACMYVLGNPAGPSEQHRVSQVRSPRLSCVNTHQPTSVTGASHSRSRQAVLPASLTSPSIHSTCLNSDLRGLDESPFWGSGMVIALLEGEAESQGNNF